MEFSVSGTFVLIKRLLACKSINVIIFVSDDKDLKKQKKEGYAESLFYLRIVLAFLLQDEQDEPFLIRMYIRTSRDITVTFTKCELTENL